MNFLNQYIEQFKQDTFGTIFESIHFLFWLCFIYFIYKVIRKVLETKNAHKAFIDHQMGKNFSINDTQSLVENKNVDNDKNNITKEILSNRNRSSSSNLITNFENDRLRTDAYAYNVIEYGDKIVIKRNISKTPIIILNALMIFLGCMYVMMAGCYEIKLINACIAIFLYSTIGVYLCHLLAKGCKKNYIFNKLNNYYWEGDINNFNVSISKCKNIIPFQNIKSLKVERDVFNTNRDSCEKVLYGVYLILQDDFKIRIYSNKNEDKSQQVAKNISMFIGARYDN